MQRLLYRKTIDQHLNLYDLAPLNEKLPVPNRLLAMYKHSIGKTETSEKEQDHLVTIWRRLVEVGRHLAILILALAHVEDLGSCERIPLICQTEALQDHPLAIELRTWNGFNSLGIGEYTWYHAIALLLLGHTMPTTLGNVPPALVSSRGWSVYVGTFLQPQTRNFEEMIDPSLVSSGRFGISIGVPWRNEVYRHAIFDGPDKGTLGHWEYEEHGGDTASLRCADQVRQGRPLHGEDEDSSKVTLRLIRTPTPNNNFTRRTGYAELFSALWLTRRTRSCDHNITSVVLDPSCVTV